MDSSLQQETASRSLIKRKADEVENSPPPKQKRQKHIRHEPPTLQKSERKIDGQLSPTGYQEFDDKSLFLPEPDIHDDMLNDKDGFSPTQDTSPSGRGFEDFTLDESLFDIIPSNESFSDTEVSRSTLTNTEFSQTTPSTSLVSNTSYPILKPSQPVFQSHHGPEISTMFKEPMSYTQPSFAMHSPAIVHKPPPVTPQLFNHANAISSSSRTDVSRTVEPTAPINSDLAEFEAWLADGGVIIED